jgi:hypothetical protein
MDSPFASRVLTTREVVIRSLQANDAKCQGQSLFGAGPSGDCRCDKLSSRADHLKLLGKRPIIREEKTPSTAATSILLTESMRG